MEDNHNPEIKPDRNEQYREWILYDLWPGDRLMISIGHMEHIFHPGSIIGILSQRLKDCDDFAGDTRAITTLIPTEEMCRNIIYYEIFKWVAFKPYSKYVPDADGCHSGYNPYDEFYEELFKLMNEVPTALFWHESYSSCSISGDIGIHGHILIDESQMDENVLSHCMRNIRIDVRRLKGRIHVQTIDKETRLFHLFRPPYVFAGVSGDSSFSELLRIDYCIEHRISREQCKDEQRRRDVDVQTHNPWPSIMTRKRNWTIVDMITGGQSSISKDENKEKPVKKSRKVEDVNQSS